MTALKAKTRAAVLQIAEWQLGVVEMPTNSNKVKYNTAYYGREVSGGAYAWCMAFIWWVFREAGFSLYKTASCTTFVNRYKTFAPGQIVTGGYKPGDIVFFDFSRKRKKTEHVGIVVAYRYCHCQQHSCYSYGKSDSKGKDRKSTRLNSSHRT